MLSTVDEVMAVEASLTVVLESCSPACLDIMRAPCGLDKNTQKKKTQEKGEHKKRKTKVKEIKRERDLMIFFYY